ncbi:hypothetical protein BAC1_01588 [uncultured bacterium]|nr:hypothetical protein BAC1_01588 [uncultured bacterium]
MKFEVRGLKYLREALDPKRYKKIATRTVNKLGAQAKTAVNRAVRGTYNISRERLDAGLYLRRATWENPVFLLKFKGRSPGLQHFDARQTRRGVTVKVKKEGGRKVVQGAFMPASIEGVYKREGAARLPIKRLYGPDIVGMVNEVGIDSVQKVLDENAERILSHEFDFEMGKNNRSV